MVNGIQMAQPLPPIYALGILGPTSGFLTTCKAGSKLAVSMEEKNV